VSAACRVWEISENVHRVELPQLERDKLMAEWDGLLGKEVRQVAAVSKDGRGNTDGSVRDTARQLGLDEKDVRRAVKVASLSPEAQAAASELGHISILPVCNSKPAHPINEDARAFIVHSW